MFEHLRSFTRVFVTGPQRSGTRICAKMIAHDTGHRYIDEREIFTNSIYKLIGLLSHHINESLIIQCPALCRWIHRLGPHDNIAVVLMRRDVQDIIRSQERVNWIWEPVELMKYDSTKGPIAEVKYTFWSKCQQGTIANPFEVEYKSLSEHPLWVPTEDRAGWEMHQTEAIHAGSSLT